MTNGVTIISLKKLFDCTRSKDPGMGESLVLACELFAAAFGI